MGPVNALAEEECGLQAARLRGMSEQRRDAQLAAQELRDHLAALSRQEQRAIALATERVSAAFADYSRALLGGSGEVHGNATSKASLRAYN